MGTSGLMLIPVTHLHTMCCRMRKMRVQWASEHSLGFINQTVPDSIWPSELHRSIRTHEMHPSNNSSRTCNRVVALQRLSWHTSQSPHAIWCSRRVRIEIGVGIGCAMAVEHWVWSNEISIDYFPTYRSVPYSRTDSGNSHAHKCNFRNFPFTNCICVSPSAAEICLQNCLSSALGINNLII